MKRVAAGVLLACAATGGCAVPLPPGAHYDAMGGDMSDVSDARDVSDASDASDVSDVSDMSDVSDARDASDGSDVSDARDASDVSDVSDVVDAGPCGGGCVGGLQCCDGVCVDTQSSLLHCGACGSSCSTAHATPSCNTGRCFVSCDPGWGNCDTSAANGCEANLNASATNCGACGNACATPAHATSAVCASARCGAGPCETGWGDCDGNATNGCETDLRVTDAHCGRCGNACGTARYCSASACIEQRSCRAEGTPGCGLVEVAAGTFTMGAPVACGGSLVASCAIGATPTHSTRVDSFAVDAYEVSVGRFRAFWAARPGDLARIRAAPVVYRAGHTLAWTVTAQPPSETATSSRRGCNWSVLEAGREAHPMNCIDWWLAQEFCVWDGGRLPTEAEWEYAARGRVVAGLATGRLYPWGDQEPVRSPTCDRAHYGCAGTEDGSVTRRVGSFAASGGLYDLAGNVWEWTADVYASYETGACWMDTLSTNPLCELSATVRTIRGGSWYYEARPGLLRSASRESSEQNTLVDSVGFRCARTR